MSKYDDLFDATAPDDSVFADKQALNPLAEPAEIHAREAQERALATLLNGVHEGDLPTGSLRTARDGHDVEPLWWDSTPFGRSGGQS